MWVFDHIILVGTPEIESASYPSLGDPSIAHAHLKQALLSCSSSVSFNARYLSSSLLVGNMSSAACLSQWPENKEHDAELGIFYIGAWK